MVRITHDAHRKRQWSGFGVSRPLRSELRESEHPMHFTWTVVTNRAGVLLRAFS